MNPLIRWTIGPVHDCGFDVLEESVRQMRKIYSGCDFVICHNQLSPQQLERIGRLDVQLMDQSTYITECGIAPRVGYSVEWKLYPPRLRPRSHEIFMDNDIIICNRVLSIDKWLGHDNETLLYQGLHGLHGAYAKMVPKGVRINSGIFGLPPNFQFDKKIAEKGRQFTSYFDEQGLVASILLEQPHTIIPLTVIPIIEHNWSLEAHDKNKECCGYHFVDANKKDHPEFRKFMLRKTLL